MNSHVASGCVCKCVCLERVLSVCVMRLVCRLGVSMKILNSESKVFSNPQHLCHILRPTLCPTLNPTGTFLRARTEPVSSSSAASNSEEARELGESVRPYALETPKADPNGKDLPSR